MYYNGEKGVWGLPPEIYYTTSTLPPPPAPVENNLQDTP